MKKEQISISITPFDSEIVGSDDKFLYFKEIYSIDDSEDSLYCVIKIRKGQFKKMVNLFIERKTEICKIYGHFCGVFGNFYIDKFKKIGEIDLLTGFDENKGEDGEPVYENVPIFQVIKFDHHCDMEHG